MDQSAGVYTHKYTHSILCGAGHQMSAAMGTMQRPSPSVVHTYTCHHQLELPEKVCVLILIIIKYN